MIRRRFFNTKDTSNKYLTIVALEDDLTVSLSENSCEYCVDCDGNWITLPADTQTPSINAGQTLSFRGNLVNFISYGIGTFTISKRCDLTGYCTSMLYGGEIKKEIPRDAFMGLFQNCTTIKNVSNDFLPATTLAEDCYNAMFDGCTSLTTAPELPATTLAYECYSYMFQGCTNLNYIKMLATDISAKNCLYNWVSGVASSGTFVKNSAMTSLPTGVSGIPEGWTVQNA